MSIKSLILLLCLSAFSLSAYADEWTKTYQVGNNPNLHVDTNDASIDITHGVSNTINARVVADGVSDWQLRRAHNRAAGCRQSGHCRCMCPTSGDFTSACIGACRLRYRCHRNRRWICILAMVTSR